MLLVTYSRKECQKTEVDQGPSVSNCINPSLKSSIPLQSQFCEQIAPSSPNKNTSTMYTFALRDGDHRVLFSITKKIPRKKPKHSVPHTLRQSEYSKLASVFWSPGEVREAFKVCSSGRNYYPKGTHWEERWKYNYCSNWPRITTNIYSEFSGQIIAGSKCLVKSSFSFVGFYRICGGEMFFFMIYILWILGIKV